MGEGCSCCSRGVECPGPHPSDPALRNSSSPFDGVPLPTPPTAAQGPGWQSDPSPSTRTAPVAPSSIEMVAWPFEATIPTRIGELAQYTARSPTPPPTSLGGNSQIQSYNGGRKSVTEGAQLGLNT